MQPSVKNVKKHYVCIALLNVEWGCKEIFCRIHFKEHSCINGSARLVKCSICFMEDQLKTCGECRRTMCRDCANTCNMEGDEKCKEWFYIKHKDKHSHGITSEIVENDDVSSHLSDMDSEGPDEDSVQRMKRKRKLEEKEDMGKVIIHNLQDRKIRKQDVQNVVMKIGAYITTCKLESL